MFECRGRKDEVRAVVRKKGRGCGEERVKGEGGETGGKDEVNSKTNTVI